MRTKDELYIFIYDKDQTYIPSVSRVYGSDFRKISDVSHLFRGILRGDIWCLTGNGELAE